MTAEDYLEILAGLQVPCAVTKKFNIDLKDIKLMHSLASQSAKGIAFTDRQHILVKNKLLQYEPQLVQHGYCNLKTDLDKLRLPYRTINREKSINLVERKLYEDFFNQESRVLMLAIRFPFSKKMIKHINLIKSIQDGSTGYDSKTKTHFVRFNETNVYTIVSNFKECNFKISQEILDYYANIIALKEDSNNTMPGIYNWKLSNLPNKTKEYAENLFGAPNPDNITLYFDRKDLLGLVHFDKSILSKFIESYDWLTQQIIYRSHKHIFINRKDFVFSQILQSILNLKRFPILFVLGKNTANYWKNYKNVHEQLYYIHQFLDRSCDKQLSHCVMFRLDNSIAENIDFNQYVKEHNLNGKISQDTTDVVYICGNKLPKPLIVSGWKPQAIVVLDNRRLNKFVQLFIESSSLTIHYDDIAPYWQNTPFTIIP